MAAFDPPWLTHMSAPRSQRSGDSLDRPSTPSGQQQQQQQRNTYSNDGAVASAIPSSTPNPTYATFSPTTLSSTAPSATTAAKRRSTILVHQKSPLLLATPPQITRALAYSHPFLLPLNKLVGLLTWTTGDPWESFLLLVVFWAAVLYGDIVVRMAGPVVLVLILIGGMYARRFSPLSSSGWSEPGLGAGDGTALGGGGGGGTEAKNAKVTKKTSRSKNLSVDGLPDKNGKASAGAASGVAGGGGHSRNQGSVSEVTNTRHQKTLDEIVETLKEFTARCNILLEPLLEMTDFLSTQQTPTSATTRPALTTLFVRILLCTPFWFLLTLPPLRIITTRRVIMLCGTILLTHHARVMRVARAILWRSSTVRRLMVLVTGLQFEGPEKAGPGKQAAAAEDTTAAAANSKTKTFTSAAKPPRESELTKAIKRARGGGGGTGVRFTFIIYENQRRWVGLGWTTSMFGYERPAWTDEHNNSVPPRDQFELPEVEDGSNMRWRWAEGSRWRVDGVPDEAVVTVPEEGKEWDYDGSGGRMGWVYYDNKWQNGRRGQDGWGRWTRRRKWYRDAELVEADSDVEDEQQPAAANGHANADQQPPTPAPSLPPRPETLSPIAGLPSSYEAEAEAEGSISNSQRGKSDDNDERDKDSGRYNKEDEYDSASLLSTSSRSLRFKAPSLRRRVTETSTQSHRSRRASNSTVEDDAAALGTQVGLAMQDAGKEVGSWGIGDELRMGLE
ncbi:integral peroxisomal membrane peroxin-domain-containing protein [Podospora appendiculata]|uniref:Integral peroxisomal membrane peroxin-domain-containing protein n=1 Tax=Podospora appendiculata TaxID=314037 RepID=A0AAE0X153_9PEZI|nr:integral peroxisomal membrane peroxin-domain-containing protein [Podospora appendiculata]